MGGVRAGGEGVNDWMQEREQVEEEDVQDEQVDEHESKSRSSCGRKCRRT